MAEGKDDIRKKVFSTYRSWSSSHRRLVLICPWCGEPIEDGFHRHEWLVKQSGTNTQHRDLIMVVENCVPLHPQCHERFGQTYDMALRCLEYTARLIGASRVGTWYVGLWRDHGLSVKKGLLREPGELPLYLAREMFMEGARVLSPVLPESWVHPDDPAIDVRDCAFSAIVRKKNTTHKQLADLLPQKFGDLPARRLTELARTGYWVHYIRGIIGG